MPISELPFIDAHATDIDAPVSNVWPALVEQVGAMLSGRIAPLFARAVGCDDRDTAGPRPLAEGATVPGFRVASVIPGTELVLEGHHRYSTYALTFRVKAIGERRTRLRAETRATFPGLAAGVYRLVVVGTGGHEVAVRRLLAGVRRRVESAAESRD
jgi:hypothetical protein